MCLAVLAFDVHPRFAVVIAANRDEFHARPCEPAAWWDEGWLAGRDLKAGGTWLGVTREGRYALLTNVRDPSRKNNPVAPSRGLLVPQVLAAAGPIPAALERARIDGARHNGFNLLAGTRDEAAWTSNHAERSSTLAAGLYGLSNAQLDVPWPKVERTKAVLVRWVGEGNEDPSALFAALGDRTLAPDAALPSTGVTLDWERRLSAPFIQSDAYGTRSSTVLTIDRDGDVRFIERSFDANGDTTGEVENQFRAVR